MFMSSHICTGFIWPNSRRFEMIRNYAKRIFKHEKVTQNYNVNAQKCVEFRDEIAVFSQFVYSILFSLYINILAKYVALNRNECFYTEIQMRIICFLIFSHFVVVYKFDLSIN